MATEEKAPQIPGATMVDPDEAMKIAQEQERQEIEGGGAASLAGLSQAVDQQSADPQPEGGTDRELPTFIQEKFRGTDDPVTEQAKAYAELEKSKGQALTVNREQLEPEPIEFDLDRFTQEFMTDGNLSEESWAQVRKAGIPDKVVNTYLGDRKREREEAHAAVVEIAGGDEGLKRLQAFLRDKSKVSDRELGAFNEAMESGNRDLMELTMRGMVDKFRGTPHGAQTPLEGGFGAPAVQPFASETEAMIWMDKRDEGGRVLYEVDDEYRAKVDARLAAGHAPPLPGR